MLEVSQITRCYGDYKAVDNVSFTIGKGEIVGLLGHNGAGKTTIMKMLSGYLEPDHGAISIAGLDMQSSAKQIQQKLGYLPENLPLYPEMTVADYLDYAADLKGLVDNDKRYQIKRAITATELADQMLSLIATLSRGYKQRVGVAQALLGEPQLLILDEPTNGLDPTQTEHMRKLIREIAKRATVILSTHIMQEVDALCDRALIVRNGQLVVDARLAELRQSNAILLETSMALTDLQQRLAGIKTISEITQRDLQDSSDALPQVNYYRVTIAQLDQAKATCAEIAKAVVDAKAQLFSMNPEHRDLETLFREVNQGTFVNIESKEVKDAA
jgi:ABC-2 type transport system ATP-binding protein